MKYLITTLLLIGFIFAEEARIVQLNGDVQIRRGLDEDWSKAKNDMLLKEIDTILTGESGQVVLELSDGRQFSLRSNSILDIADLRKISEKELFLFLMRQKVDRLEDREAPAQLKLGKVSVVHGNKSKQQQAAEHTKGNNEFVRESNGVSALYEHGFFSNVIIKAHRILDRKPEISECTMIYEQLAEALEAVEKPEQAKQQFKAALEHAQKCGDSESAARYKEALDRLKN
ncbi:MAG: hypothetical protein AAFP70_04800 [Calditrichota bacterium]